MIMRLSTVLFVFCLSNVSRADFSYLSLKAGTWSFSTTNIQNSQTENSGIGAYSFEYGYGMTRRLLFSAGFNILFTDIYSGSSGYGFDVGAKYFPLTDIGTLMSSSDNALMELREVWRPYIGLFLRQRTFNLALTSGYAGPGVTVGLDYAPRPSWYLSVEYRQDLLFGSANSEVIQTNILFGLGLEL